ncbi:MAG: tRNA (guanosine(37)-N1)-methyltransferase TrmD [Armatimonadetes bacterium]|nr:tRNA (guanosine(37)-N1)-methyltransferase TrmD [Armatimonadota bacterium]
MRIDIVTTLPEMITPALETSILKRASERGIVEFRVVNLRDYTHDRHRTTDDAPYAGGGGMVMKIEPITAALEDLLGSSVDEAQADTEDVVPRCKPRVVLTDPRGQQWTQELAREWAQEAHIILLCGHYEGVDDRVRQHLVTDEVSIGDYVLTGGELPALVITDSLTRLQAGALGDSEAPNKDTFSGNLLEYPHFTRPREFRGWRVPDILLSGNHALIEKWRRWNQLRTTRERRPDLFAKLSLTAKDYALMEAEEPQAPVE